LSGKLVIGLASTLSDARGTQPGAPVLPVGTDEEDVDDDEPDDV
jgi:hypothetical protein